MAALRVRWVRVLFAKETSRLKTAQKAASRKMKMHKGPIKSYSRRKTYVEVVATSEQEANSGLFAPVGDIYVFKPEDNEAFLWERVRNMSDEDNYEVWSMPGIGIRAALKKMNVDYPKQLNSDPARLLELPAKTGSGYEHSGSETFVLHPFERIFRQVWIPSFVYKTELGRSGLFPKKKTAQAVAALYGITVNLNVPSSQWYRSPLPDVVSDVMRSNQIDESAYQHWKQVLLSTAEAKAEAGEVSQINWDIVERTIRDEAGPHTASVMSRLHAELDPELARLAILAQRRKADFEDNGPRKHLRRVSRT